MFDRYVVSKSRRLRIPCDGPLTAQIERGKLVESMIAAGYTVDVEIEFPKKPRTVTRTSKGRKQGTKLRYK
jgi:hypothetical protein